MPETGNDQHITDAGLREGGSLQASRFNRLKSQMCTLRAGEESKKTIKNPHPCSLVSNNDLSYY